MGAYGATKGGQTSMVAPQPFRSLSPGATCDFNHLQFRRCTSRHPWHAYGRRQSENGFLTSVRQYTQIGSLAMHGGTAAAISDGSQFQWQQPVNGLGNRLDYIRFSLGKPLPRASRAPPPDYLKGVPLARMHCIFCFKSSGLLHICSQIVIADQKL